MSGLILPKKEIINRGRRKLLKALPFVAAAPAIIKSRVAEAMLFKGSGAGPGIASPATPAIASANGYNTATLYDDFINLGGIDVNNTLSPGYKWYVQTYGGGGPEVIPPSALSLSSPSILKLDMPPGGSGWLVNAGLLNTTNYVGSGLAPTGWYSEARIALSGNTFPVGGGGGYFFFDLAMAFSTGFDENLGFSFPGCELDVFEYGSNGTTTIDFNLHQWNTYSSFAYTQGGNNPLGSVDYTQFHKYGCLWLPTYKNSGTGVIQMYFDGSAVAGTLITYSQSGAPTPTAGQPTGTYYSMETAPSGHQLLLGSGVGTTGTRFQMYVDYLGVWQ